MAAIFPSDHIYAGNTPEHLLNDDGSESVSTMMSRAESVASDGRSSVVSGMTATVPTYLSHVRPPPEYVSPASAAQVATDAQVSSRGSVSADEDEDSFDRNGQVAVAEGAVALVNAFLDKLLYDFLATARSTSLLALKPAVNDVLKKNLARDAIARAEADLEDLLALRDSDDDGEQPQTPKEAGKWNLEFMWKRSRLRVMMRSDKSEFDIDDDERYVREEGLQNGRRFSQTTVISLGAEIFLAGVLDFIAEQILYMASHNAAIRKRRHGINTRADPGLQAIAHILVQEPDVEKAALNSSLERLWRGWRKAIRPRGPNPARRGSRSISDSPTLTRRESLPEGALMEEVTSNIPDMDYPEHVLASNIPLPLSDRDVEEIETPWLARDPDEKVPQEHVTNGRLGHRVIKSFGNASYFAPMRRHDHDEARPSSSPQPNITPAVDAPGAWPGETPAEEIVEPLSNADLDQEDVDHSTRGVSEAPDAAEATIAQTDVSESAPSDPSHPEADVQALAAASPENAKSADTQKRESKSLAVAAAAAGLAGLAGAATAVSAAVMQKSHDDSEKQDARLSAEFKRKSIGDMKSLITESTSRGHGEELDNRAATGTFLVADESDDEGLDGVSHKNARTTQSNTLHDQTATPLAPEQASHIPTETVVREPVLNDSPILSSSDSQITKKTLLTKTGPSPPRSPLAPRNSLGRGTGDASQSATSAKDTLSSKNISSSSSALPINANGELSRTPTVESSQDLPGTTPAETLKEAEAPQTVVKETPRALQGLGISRQPSDELKSAKRGSTVLPTRADEESNKVRKSYRSGDTDLSTSNSRRSSLKPFAVVDMDDSGKASSGKLTSASISSPEDFDMMVQSNDTIKYTLTPETARDIPTSAFNPQVKITSRSRLSGSKESISSLVGSKRPQPPPLDTDTVGPRPGRSATSSPATVPVPKDKHIATRKSSVSRPAAKNAKPTSSGQIAREPQVQTMSTRDFADFIRTTGPDKEQNPVIPLLAARSTHSLRTLANSQTPSTDRARSVSSASLAKSPLGEENVPPMPVIPSGLGTSSPKIDSPTKPLGLSGLEHRRVLQAREASGSTDLGSSSELIDFIRNGPPEQGGGRIPHNVAPFHQNSSRDGKAMDDMQSDTYQVSSTGTNQRNNGLTLQTNHRPNTGASASISSLSPSARSSFNSQARLLPSGSGSTSATPTTQPAYSAQPARLNVPGTGVPPGLVERKRHRNKDPYYIDDSEDDDLLTALPQDRRPEESLMDFLRNSEPPSNNAPKSLAAGGQAQARAMLNKARATSVNSLRAATSGSQSSTEGTNPAQSSITPPSASQAPTNGLPQGFDSNSSRSIPGSVPRNPNRAKMQVRDAGTSRKTARIGGFDDSSTSTGDLADFLRSSGPPEPIKPKATFSDGAPAPVVGIGGQRSEKKKGVKFWKR